MAGDASQRDLQIISDGVLHGLGTMDQLPTNVRTKLLDYWGSMGIDATDPNSQFTQKQLDELKKQRDAQEGGFFNSSLFKPIEWVGSKIYQVYSATASPILSSSAMAAHSIIYGRPDYIGQDGEADALKDYWDYAHKVSPGQAIWMLGMNDKELKDRGIRPDQIAHDADLQAKGKYRDEQTNADPLGIYTRAQEYFGHGASKYVTGGTDFALSWYADPLALAGKAAGGVKAAKFTRPVGKEIALNEKVALKANPSLTVEEANKLAWDNLSQKSHFEGMVDQAMKIKKANPDTAAAVLTRDFPTLNKSANGPAVAKLLNQAVTRDEVANIFRVTMGDAGAREALRFQNVELSYQLDQLTAKQSLIGGYYNGLTDAQQATPWGQRVKQQMTLQSKAIAQLDRDSQIVTDKMNAFASLGEMNFNNITTNVGMKTRSAWQSSRSWQPFQDGGFIKSQVNNAYSLSLGGVVKLVHTYNDLKPSHYIDVKDDNGWRQLQAGLIEARGLTQEARDMYVSHYLNTPVELRAAALQDIEQKVVHNMVDRYNLQPKNANSQIHHDVAEALYREVALKRGKAQGGMNGEAFGTVRVDSPTTPGASINVDEIAPDGGKVVVTPLLRSQMANNHVMIDFKLFNKVLEANGSAWSKARLQGGANWQKATDIADFVNHIWKFSQLFRLGYGPRALADDGLGQLARFGPLSILDRSIKGGKFTWEDMRRAATPESVMDNLHVARGAVETHIDDLTMQQAKIQAELDKARMQGRPTAQHEQDLEVSKNDLLAARTDLAKMDSIVKGGAAMKHVGLVDEVFGPSYGGTEGGLYKDLASGDKNYQNMMGSAGDSYLNRLRRMDWTLLSPAKHGESVHMANWIKVLNHQVANDALSVQYLKGATPTQLEAWLARPEGLAYKRNHRIAKHLPNDQLVERVTAQLDEWMNHAFPGSDVIRRSASEGKVTEEMLKEVPMDIRPLVNGQALAYARGSHDAIQLMDKGMDAWYNLMASAPSRYLLRNPLFAQRYKIHLRDIMSVSGKTEVRMTEELRKSMESAARKRALQDVKKNTFTMDYETKMSYMMKNFGAFFGAQQESWNRWARIISDKPDILVRVAQVYGAPTRAGIVTDADGHKINPDGTVIDPITGEKRLVDYADRHIVIQIPDYLGGKQLSKFFGTGGKTAMLGKDGQPKRDKNGNIIYTQENFRMDIPMSTAEIILNHGDGPIPVGAGPYVQIAANHMPKWTGLNANEEPDMADLYQKLGILPFGPSDSLDTFLPNWWRKGEASRDTTSEAYQKMMWYTMQAEDYKYRSGLRKTPPSWTEIKDRADRQSWLKVLTAATLPISFSAKDPYQFFRDQYRQMQDLDFETADQNFYDKFGDSAYVFTQSLSKNNSGLKPTAESVKMSKHYQDLISETNDNWAGLVVGAEGEGAYSDGAFYYEKTHSVDPAGGETSRSTMSAKDALAQSELSRGWNQFKAKMNGLHAELFARGLKTFDDAGAEDLKAEKQATVRVLSSPQLLDANGNLVDNKFYNKAWSAAYNSLDVNYYDRATNDLRVIANDPELTAKSMNPDGSAGMRSDIYYLKIYLAYRDDVKRGLLMRKAAGGSENITAGTNADIKSQWDALVLQLIQKDTKFGDLHSRYLSRDMGFDQETVQQEQQQGFMDQFQGATDKFSADQTSIFDVMAQKGSI